MASKPVRMLTILVPVLCSLSPNAIADEHASCSTDYYAGFNSRLEVSASAVLSPDTGRIVDFQVSGGVPFVALTHRVLRLEPKGISAITSLDPISNLILTRSGEIRISTSQGLRKVGNGSFVPETRFGTEGRVYDDGNPLLLKISTDGQASDLSVLKASGSQFKIIRSTIPFHAVGWNQIGFSAVLGDTLATWTADSAVFQALAVDSSLLNARGTCLIGDGRVAVALSQAVVVVSRYSRLVVAAMRARLRFEDGVLYVLYEQRGKIFAVRGLERFGSTERDEALARQLLQAPNQINLLEAARILGCQEVQKELNR